MGNDNKGWVWMIALLLLAIGVVAGVSQRRIVVVQAQKPQYLKRQDSVDDVIARLGARVDKDPNALFAISDAVAMCTPILRDWVRRRGMAPSDRAFWRWQASYCHHISRATPNFYYSHGVMIDMRTRHPDWDFRPGHEASYLLALYASVLRDAPAPDLRSASFALADGRYANVAWRYGREAVARGRHPERLAAYQRMAVRLVECDLMGGCGRNGVIAFELCNEERNCRWGISVTDILRERFEPDEVAIIETLHRRIANERAAYVRSHALERRAVPFPKDPPWYGYRTDENHWLARWNARRLVPISRRRAVIRADGAGSKEHRR